MKALYTKAINEAVSIQSTSDLITNLTSIISSFRHRFSCDDILRISPRAYHAVITSLYSNGVVDHAKIRSALKNVQWGGVVTSSTLDPRITELLDGICEDLGDEVGKELRDHPATKAFMEALMSIMMKHSVSQAPEEVKTLIRSIDSGVESGLSVTGLMEKLNEVCRAPADAFGMLLDALEVRNKDLISYNYNPVTVSTSPTSTPDPRTAELIAKINDRYLLAPSDVIDKLLDVLEAGNPVTISTSDVAGDGDVDVEAMPVSEEEIVPADSTPTVNPHSWSALLMSDLVPTIEKSGFVTSGLNPSARKFLVETVKSASYAGIVDTYKVLAAVKSLINSNPKGLDAWVKQGGILVDTAIKNFK
jgi:hypothetical protein